MMFGVPSACFVRFLFFFFSSRRRHTRFDCDWSSDVCFFEEEDGIRDLTVTGVQTCALPISWDVVLRDIAGRRAGGNGRAAGAPVLHRLPVPPGVPLPSEPDRKSVV